MNKFWYVFLGAAVIYLLSPQANAKDYGRDLIPEHKIGNLYCYEGWNGDTDIMAHALLTDRPLRAEVCRGEADPCLSVRKGTKVIDIEVEHFVDDKKRGWEVTYSDRVFYRAHKQVALRCMRMINPYAAKEFPFTRIRKETFRSNTRRY